MGQPKMQRKKYDTPNHPWQGDRIKAENEVVRKFGLKNKREIWRAQTRLREIRGQARGLISRSRNPDDKQAVQEAEQLLARLHRQGYTGDNTTLNEVLGLDVERILNRRLQSQVYLKGMARTMKQARQFVSHGVVRIGARRVTVPGYVVRRDEEDQIAFDPAAAVADDDHPVRPKPEGYEVHQETTTSASTVQEEAKPTARPDAHPADRDEAPAQASEEPNVTKITPAPPEATPEPEASQEAEAATEAPAEPAPAESKPEPDTPEPAATEAPAEPAPAEPKPEPETPEPAATEAPAEPAPAEPKPEPETPEPEAADSPDDGPATDEATGTPAEPTEAEPDKAPADERTAEATEEPKAKDADQPADTTKAPAADTSEEAKSDGEAPEAKEGEEE